MKVFLVNKRGKDPGIHRVLIYIYILSYIAIDFNCNRKETFYRWSRLKRKLNLKSNIAIFDFLGNSDFDKRAISGKYCKQFVLESIGGIISQHYKRRLRIYNFSQKIPFKKKSIFIIMSLLYAYVDELSRFIRSFSNLRFRYKLNRKKILNKVDLAIGFPEHGFSVMEVEDAQEDGVKKRIPASSFARYHFENHFDKQIISVDEYIRPSKHVELIENKKTTNESISILGCPRVKPVINKGLYVFFLRSPEIIFEGFKLLFNISVGLRYSLLEIEYFIKWTRSYNYYQLLKYFRVQNISVESVFILPFSDDGLLSYDKKIGPMIRTYNYGSNIYVPPKCSNSSLKGKDFDLDIKPILSDVPIAAFCLSGQAIGFTRVFEQINGVKKALNDKYSCNLPVEKSTLVPECPVLVGYESPVSNFTKKALQRYIAVFDVPPESSETHLSRVMSGDRTCDYQIIAEFLTECINICVLEGYNVVFKPKYSLSNYDEEYRSLIESFCARLGDRFVVVDPYVNLVELLELVQGVVNFPYTSTKLIAEAMGKDSVYYMPDVYRDSFSCDSGSKDFIIGENELCLFLKSINTERDIAKSNIGLR